MIIKILNCKNSIEKEVHGLFFTGSPGSGPDTHSYMGSVGTGHPRQSLPSAIDVGVKKRAARAKSSTWFTVSHMARALIIPLASYSTSHSLGEAH